MSSGIRDTATPIVLDTSVLVKWFKSGGEELTAEAESLREVVDERKIPVHVPTLVYYELGNVLLVRSELDREGLLEALRAIRRLPVTPVAPGFRLLARAAQVARDFRITFYDASFVALAAELSCTLVTADKQLSDRLDALDFVVHLSRIETHLP